MSARFVPVDIKLEPRESINSPLCHIVMMQADDKISQTWVSCESTLSQRRVSWPQIVVESQMYVKLSHVALGLIDQQPYVVFTLNGAKVFKTETKKKYVWTFKALGYNTD